MPRPPPPMEPLSDREREIALAYSKGSSYKQTAEQFGIAPATVRTHLAAIYRKLGVSSKIELLYALGNGLTDAAPAPTQPVVQARRLVTVLSVAPDGFDALAATLEPEDMASLITGFHHEVEAAIERHGGNRLSHDGADVTIFFGAPTADETDAERAVNCALDICDGLDLANASGTSPLRVQIGVFTGLVVASTSENQVKTMLGGAPYLAAALRREAQGGGIVVCARTHAMLRKLFAFTDLGPISLEAGAPGIETFGVRAASDAPTRFERLHGYRLSPMIGREHELGLLATLFARAKAGDGQVALITGEPGIGKSRLVRNLADHLAEPSASIIVLQCSPLDQSIPLHPVTETLKSLAGTNRTDTAEKRLAAVMTLFANVLARPGADTDLEAALVADIALGQGPSSANAVNTAPDKWRAATLELLDAFIAQSVETKGARLLVFEDMHWADPTTIAWLDGLVDLVETAPVMIVATARPEFMFHRAGAHITTLALSRLSQAQAEDLVVAQTGERSLTREQIVRIAERSEGIPLYAEELARAILELGEAEDAVPTTLSASLQGRLDRLGPVREVAQAAAVIGRDFDSELLAEIVPIGAKTFDKAIKALVASRLVLRRGGANSAAFQFKHALIRDAAYQTLLRDRREAMHHKLAQALIARRDNGQDVSAAIIAGHLTQGGARADAVPFWRDAVDTALIRGAEREASAFCDEGLAASLEIDDPREQDRARCDLLQLKQGADYSQGDVAHLLKIIDQAETCARRLGDERRLGLVLHSKVYNLTNSGQVERAIEVARSAIAISTSKDDRSPWIMANIMLARSLYAAGHYTEAVDKLLEMDAYFANDLERGAVGGDAMNQTASVPIWLSLILPELGRFDEAERHSRRADAFIEALPTREHLRLWWALGAGRVHGLQGRPRTVVEIMTPHTAICDASYPVYFPRLAMSLGPALLATGATEKGLALLSRARLQASEMGFTFLRSLLLAQYSAALLASGDEEAARECAEEAMAVAERTGETGNLGWALLRFGEAACKLGLTEKAAQAIAHAQRIAQSRRMATLSAEVVNVNLVPN